MTKEDIQKFLDSHPMVRPYGLAKESEISYTLIQMILKGTRRITADKEAKIFRVMIKYGYKP